jgi:hypothetical protein
VVLRLLLPALLRLAGAVALLAAELPAAAAEVAAEPRAVMVRRVGAVLVAVALPAPRLRRADPAGRAAEQAARKVAVVREAVVAGLLWLPTGPALQETYRWIR